MVFMIIGDRKLTVVEAANGNDFINAFILKTQTHYRIFFTKIIFFKKKWHTIILIHHFSKRQMSPGKE